MDLMSINDLLLECIRAGVLVALLVILFLRGRFTKLARQPGWKSILSGFCLVTLATLLDITDEIPGLDKYVIIGDTVYEAFLEKLPGYLLGFMLILIGFFKMIPSLQKAEENEEALQESEERFRKIFIANPDPVILARLGEGSIIDVNPAFVKQIGFSREAVLGKNSSELEVWENPEQRTDFLDQLTSNKELDNYEANFRIKGQVFTCLLSAQVVTIAAEACILVVLRDITRIKKAEQALLETDKIRRDFISTAAHELRTPLSVLTGYAELLTSGDSIEKLSDQQRLECLAEIKQKGFVLSDMVDDLLDLSRIDAGLKFGLKYETVQPDRLLRKGLKQFQVQLLDCSFSLDLAEDAEFEIECDSQRILQVLENLLSNSVKYSAGQCRTRLSSVHSQDRYEFSVSDSGIGMSAEQIEKVFDKFYRVDSSNTAVAGLGLGLSIVKQIVDAHGGTVAIDSTPGQGTRVTVMLPRRRPKPPLVEP
ncbi:MAG: hypothetical protein C0619_09060 [Desulfuromonas sp.]|nr:MAG: hypothetical protein C0619_09060 [Desulfuromonas sp.]